MTKEEKKALEEQVALDGQSYTQDELDAKLKEQEGNSQKGVQKLISKQKAYDEVFKHLGAVSDDPNKLIELHESKPDVADIILEKYYEGKSIDEVKEMIGYKPDMSDPEQMQKIIDQQVSNTVRAKSIEEKKKAFVKHLRMDGEELENFESTFTEIVAMKSFNMEKLDETLEKAYMFSNGNSESLKEYKNNTAIAGVMSTGSGGSTTTGGVKKKKGLDSPDNAARKEVREMMNRYKTT